MSTETHDQPPHDDLFRAVFPGVELRAADQDGETPPTMVGHFAVFNQWTEINSIFEGHFLERFAPRAFKKTFREGVPKVLFQHGRDFYVGDKPLGAADVLREDDQGAYYEVPLLEADYVREHVLPGLEKDLYGASFRFTVVREEWVDEPDPSDHNPTALPERTVKEAKVPEFGPVTFPAYEGASAGVRSLTDDVRVVDRLADLLSLSRAARNPDRVRDLAKVLVATERSEESNNAPPKGDAGTQSHLDRGRRAPQTTDLYGLGREERRPNWSL